MKTDTPFDKKIESWNRHNPNVLEVSNICWSDLKDAAIFVTDTLGLADASAHQVFGGKSTPEIALAIYDRILERIEAKHEPK